MCGLRLKSIGVKQGLGIAVRLLHPLEHQGAGRLIGQVCIGAGVRIGRHGTIQRVAGVLGVHLGGHSQKGRVHLFGRADAVQQPVGDMLGADPQGGAVLHQADVVDVGHLGAADPLVDPADDIAEDALGVVVQFVLDLVGAPVGVGRQRDGQDVCPPD